ncbi:MAG: hypothetical protein IKX77_02435, partial [Clostridia bacterium]|nr:hypothetical protein [Clostridia bacterium]
MKKSIVILIFAFMFCLSSCIKIDVNVEKTTDDDTSKENVTISIGGGNKEDENEEKTIENTPDPLPKDGLWYAVNDLTPDVEYFVIKGTSSRKYDAKTGDETIYTCTPGKGSMKVESVDGTFSDTAEYKIVSDDVFTMAYKYGDGKITYTYTRFDDADPDTFEFNSDNDIIAAARHYYSSRTNHIPEFIYVESNEFPKTAVVHLYDLYDGHTSTCDWYYIDRFTLKGKNILEEEVDLNSPIAEYWDPEIPVRDELAQSGDFCGIVYLGGIDPDCYDFESVKEAALNSGYAEKYDFIADIPMGNFASTINGTELYLVIPADRIARVFIDEYNFIEDYPIGRIYAGYKGTPFLLKCNYSDISSDVRIG